MRNLVRYAVGLALISLLILSVPSEDIMRAARRFDQFSGCAAAFLAAIQQLLMASRLQTFTAALGLHLRYSTVCRINLSSVFYGLLLPAGNVSGAAMRLYQMSREGGSFAEPTVALVFDRLTATITMCALGCLFCLLDENFVMWPVFAFFVAATTGLAALYMAVFLRLPIVTPLEARMAARWPKILGKLHAALMCSRGVSTNVVLLMFGLCIIGHLISAIAYFAVAWGLGLDLSIWTIAWTRSATLLVAILPVSVAGLGLREGTLVVLLGPYGVAPAEAIAYGLLVFATTGLTIGLIGAALEGHRWRGSQSKRR